MPISRVKSSFPEFGILAVRKRELIIEEIHRQSNPKLLPSEHLSIRITILYFSIN